MVRLQDLGLKVQGLGFGFCLESRRWGVDLNARMLLIIISLTVFIIVILGRPLGYLICSLMAVIRDPIY